MVLTLKATRVPPFLVLDSMAWYILLSFCMNLLSSNNEVAGEMNLQFAWRKLIHRKY